MENDFHSNDSPNDNLEIDYGKALGDALIIQKKMQRQTNRS